MKQKNILLLLLCAVITPFINVKGQAYPYLGQIMWVPYNFAPKGWAKCEGQILAISQNTALFSLLGTYYGGDGKTTFALPNLKGRTMIFDGQGPGLSPTSIGDQKGNANVTLIQTEMPAHNHTIKVSKEQGTSHIPTDHFIANTKTLDKEYSTEKVTTTLNPLMLTPAGSNQPHNNMQPYTTMTCIIALQGNFPQRP